MLNYLMRSIRPDIAMAAHQMVQFYIEPKRSHEKAVICIARYLQCTAKYIGVLKGLEVYVDADFASCWTKESSFDPNGVLF